MVQGDHFGSDSTEFKSQQSDYYQYSNYFIIGKYNIIYKVLFSEIFIFTILTTTLIKI